MQINSEQIAEAVETAKAAGQAGQAGPGELIGTATAFVQIACILGLGFLFWGLLRLIFGNGRSLNYSGDVKRLDTWQQMSDERVRKVVKAINESLAHTDITIHSSLEANPHPILLERLKKLEAEGKFPDVALSANFERFNMKFDSVETSEKMLKAYHESIGTINELQKKLKTKDERIAQLGEEKNTLFNVLTSLSQGSQEQQVAGLKGIKFGLLYGMGARKLYERLKEEMESASKPPGYFDQRN